MLGAGETAPDFTLPADDGRPVTLSDVLTVGPVVLFFYPRAMTPGCTQESCMFRDRASEFTELGAQRLGISLDSVERQHRFRTRHGFDFPLLSDKGGALSKRFGVKRPALPFTRRTTFVIDVDRRILAAVHSEFDVDRHSDEALRVLRQRAEAAG